MRALVYCNFLREVRLGGWGSEGPTLGQYVRVCAVHLHYVRKWKYIVRFETIYFFLEKIMRFENRYFMKKLIHYTNCYVFSSLHLQEVIEL